MSESRYDNITGRIYKLYTTLGDEIYVGCTILDLSKRLYDHTKKYKQYVVNDQIEFETFIILYQKYGIENVHIELVEDVKCETRYQLFERKQYYIQLWFDKCVNRKQLIGIDRGYYHQYRLKNLDKIKKYAKLYRKPQVRRVDRHFKHPRVVCVCGSVISKMSLYQHLKTAKHVNYIEQSSQKILTSELITHQEIAQDVLDTVYDMTS